MSTETDTYAKLIDAGCDYCGHRSGLERYGSPRNLDNGIRCIDAKACNTRELAVQVDDEDTDA